MRILSVLLLFTVVVFGFSPNLSAAEKPHILVLTDIELQSNGAHRSG